MSENSLSAGIESVRLQLKVVNTLTLPEQLSIDIQSIPCYVIKNHSFNSYRTTAHHCSLLTKDMHVKHCVVLVMHNANLLLEPGDELVAVSLQQMKLNSL